MTQKKNLSGRGSTVKLKSKKKRSASSKEWLRRQLNDPFVAEAKKKGYRSRAAFKLQELDDKFQFLKKAHCIVDLGAAPGGWTQVALERCGAQNRKIVGLDLLSIEPLSGAQFIQMDFCDAQAPEQLMKLVQGPVDVVLSDMAPSASGHKETDHLRIVDLSEKAIAFAVQVLKPGGIFVCKVWQGGAHKMLLDLLKKHFKTVKHFKPVSSRKESAEIYVIGLTFKQS